MLPRWRWLVAGNDYRGGRKRVEVLLSLALHGQVRAAAAAEGVSMGDWVTDAIREKVSRDAERGAGRGLRVAAASDVGRPRTVPGVAGSGDAGVGFDPLAGPIAPAAAVTAVFGEGTGFVNVTGNPKMDRLNDAIERVMAEKAAARSLVGADEPALPFADGWVDPAEGIA